MTECERFIKEGRFSPDFFKEEVRCDFLVDKHRKKVWAVCLDLLLKLDAVCKKHNLRYYLAYGTLIGAVRHKGFIPWDDDVDVMMFRSDYDKLAELPEEFESPYFLQNAHTDSGVGSPVMKIRNSNTCQFNKLLNWGGYNSGMALDIFPLDNFVEEKAEEEFNYIFKTRYKNILYMKNQSPYRSEKDVELFKEFEGMNTADVNDDLHRVARKHENEETDKVWMPFSAKGKYKTNIFWKEDFAEVLLLDFEHVKLPCPKGYDRILKTTYGEYMGFPKVEDRGNYHGSIQFNPDLPYAQYMRSLGIIPNCDK